MVLNKSALNEIIRRRQEEKCRFFTPNGAQERFINVVGEGKHFVYILSAGNGIGKTAGVMNILANIVWGPQNQAFERPLFQKWPFPKRARVVTESKNIEEIGAIDQEIKTWWPKGKYKSSKSGKQYVSLYEMDNGWIMDKMSYEQEVEEFESSTLGLAVFDEPPPKPIFDATVARMRQGGIIVISMTPLGGAEWIFEDLIDSHDKDTVVLYGDMEENCKEHGTRGILEHIYLQRMLDKWPPDQRQARKEGKPLQVLSAIFGGSFVDDVHIVPDDLEPPYNSQWGITTDPADGKPYSIGLWWVDPRGHIVFDREWPEEDWIKILREKPALPRMEEYAKIFREYTDKKPLEWWIMDRHFGNNRNVLTGRSLIDDWSSLYKIDFMPSYNCEKEMEVGILKVLEYLKFDKTRPVNAMNCPRIYFKRRCKNTIKSVKKWARKIDPLRHVAKPDMDSAYKDFCDVVRYTCMKQPEVYQSRPLPATKAMYAVGR